MAFIVIGRSINGTEFATPYGWTSYRADAHRYATTELAQERIDEERQRNADRDPDSMVGRMRWERDDETQRTRR